MMDILDRLRLKIQRIPAGSYHTCGDACTNTDCLLVGARQKIEELRGLLDQIETIAVNDKSGCLRCTEIVNLIHWALRPDSATQSDQPTSAPARPCTCHQDDNPPAPCPRMYALDECRRAAALRELQQESERLGLYDADQPEDAK